MRRTAESGATHTLSPPRPTRTPFTRGLSEAAGASGNPPVPTRELFFFPLCTARSDGLRASAEGRWPRPTRKSPESEFPAWRGNRCAGRKATGVHGFRSERFSPNPRSSRGTSLWRFQVRPGSEMSLFCIQILVCTLLSLPGLLEPMKCSQKRANPTFWSSWLAQLHLARSIKSGKVFESKTNFVFLKMRSIVSCFMQLQIPQS